jgi:hypothetical protein
MYTKKKLLMRKVISSWLPEPLLVDEHLLVPAELFHDVPEVGDGKPEYESCHSPAPLADKILAEDIKGKKDSQSDHVCVVTGPKPVKYPSPDDPHAQTERRGQ